MAYTKTRQAIREAIRERGEVYENYVSNTVLNGWIDGSIAELYDLLVGVNPDFYLSSNDISVVSGTDVYSLPSDFYRVMGVDVQEGDGDWVNLQRFNFAERHMYQDGGTDRRWTRYRVLNSQLYLKPTPSWSGTVRLWYVPTPPVATGDSNTFDYIAGWEEYVVVDGCIKFASKEESDASLYAAQKNALIKRIKSMASDIDHSEPDRIRDVLTEYSGDFWPDYYNP